MIETLQWISQLAERSGLQHESCEELWSSLGNLVVERLAAATSVSVAGVVVWQVRKELEYMALLPSGGRLLVPPRLHLVVALAEANDPEDLEEALQESSPLSPKSVRAFYQALSEQMQYHLHEGNAFLWEGIGLFEGIAQEDLAYTFTPSERLLQRINKPFEAFSPILLPQDKAFDDLPQHSIEREEELTKIPVYSVYAIPPSTEADTQEPFSPTLEEESDLSPEVESEPLLPLTPLPPVAATQVELPPLPSVTPLELPTQPEETPIQSTPEPSDLECLAVSTIKEQPNEVSAQPSELEPITSAIPTPSSASPVRPKRRGKVWILILCVSLLLIGGYGVWSLLSPVAPSRPAEKKRIEATSKPEVPIADSLIVEPVPETPEEVYITIKKGDRLADYAREHYGNKKFWIYIYLANEEKISNPDNVPIGTTLRVPRPEEYGINAQDPNAVARADSLVTVLRNRL